MELVTRTLYAQQLQFVNSSVVEFKPSEHKMPKSKKEKYKYTIEESMKRRPVKGGRHMVNVYLQTRKVCVNRILVVYKEQLNDGSPPTGAAKEQFIKELRGKLGLDADDADAGGLDGAVDVDAEAEEQEGDAAAGGEEDGLAQYNPVARQAM